MNQTQTNLSQTAKPAAPAHEKVSLNEGLPKQDPRKVVEELRSHLYTNDNMKK
jgi:calmodulin